METISTSHHSSGLSSQKSSESPFIRQCVLDLKFMNRIRKLILIFGSFSTEFVLQNFVLQNVFCRILSCRISSSSFCKIRPAGFCLQNSDLQDSVSQNLFCKILRRILQNLFCRILNWDSVLWQCFSRSCLGAHSNPIEAIFDVSRSFILVGEADVLARRLTACALVARRSCVIDHAQRHRASCSTIVGHALIG